MTIYGSKYTYTLSWVGCSSRSDLSATKLISLTVMNFAAPKAGAKRELLYDKPASRLNNGKN